MDPPAWFTVAAEVFVSVGEVGISELKQLQLYLSGMEEKRPQPGNHWFNGIVLVVVKMVVTGASRPWSVPVVFT